MSTFIFKTEPSEYSFSDLVRDGRTTWDGITNAAALIHLRAVRRDDDILIYHTGEEKSIVGMARVIASPREDPGKPGKTPKGEPRFAVIDIAPIRAAAKPLSLAAIKADQRLAALPLVTHGRLSVVPVPADLDRLIRQLAGL